jgi:antitoxin YqcF
MKTQSINQKIAHWALEAFDSSGKRVVRVNDDDRVHFVDVLIASNTPTSACNSFATVTLSDHQAFLAGKLLPFRVELLGVCEKSFDCFVNIIATASFCISKSKWNVKPGEIYPDIVAMYDKTLNVKHILLADPFLWGKKFLSRTIDGRKIAWLQIVPITEEEFRYAEENGSDQLVKVFARKKIDFSNLKRSSVV